MFSLFLLSAQADAYENSIASRGRASWYGTTAHGKPTANGETYDNNALTAAHKKLPFGTVVRVHNLRNGRQVLLRINDRGPFVKGRIVDVSLRAAKALQMKKTGVAPVALEVISNKKGEPLNKNNRFYVHIADEKDPLKSREEAARLEGQAGEPVHALLTRQHKRFTYALCLGPYDTFKEAERALIAQAANGRPSIGIVEGPADGGILPRYAPPENAAGKTQTSGKNRVNLHTVWKESPLYTTSALTVHNSALVLSIVRDSLPGTTSALELFPLPYSLFALYNYIGSQI